MFQQHTPVHRFCEGLCEDATVLNCSVPSCRCSRVVGTFQPSRRLLHVPCCCCPPYGASVSSLANGFCHFLLTTFSDGCLGSNNDEGRSEVR